MMLNGYIIVIKQPFVNTFPLIFSSGARNKNARGAGIYGYRAK